MLGSAGQSKLKKSYLVNVLKIGETDFLLEFICHFVIIDQLYRLVILGRLHIERALHYVIHRNHYDGFILVFIYDILIGSNDYHTDFTALGRYFTPHDG